MSLLSSGIKEVIDEWWTWWVTLWFISDESWKVQRILSESPFFTSSYLNLQLYDTITQKQASLQPAQILSLDDYQIAASEYWWEMPLEVRNIFEKWQLLLTSWEDLYDELSSDTQRCIRSARERIIEISWWEESFYVLHYWTRDTSWSWGRWSFLVRIDNNGDVQPVTASINWDEYVIELKWSGLISWWFWELHERYDGSIWIMWWASKWQWEREFENLERLKGESFYKIAGVIYFQSPEGFPQSYIVRLTPSTIRWWYSNNSSLIDTSSEHYVSQLMWEYAYGLVNQICWTFPRIMEPDSWHLENLSINWKGAEFTDYSDQIPLGDSSVPRYSYTLNMTDNSLDKSLVWFSSILLMYINTIESLKWYKRDIHWSIFIEAIVKEFKKYWYNIDPNLIQWKAEFATTIIFDCLWKKVFQERVQNKYIPKNIIEELLLPENASGYIKMFEVFMMFWPAMFQIINTHISDEVLQKNYIDSLMRIAICIKSKNIEELIIWPNAKNFIIFLDIIEGIISENRESISDAEDILQAIDAMRRDYQWFFWKEWLIPSIFKRIQEYVEDEQLILHSMSEEAQDGTTIHHPSFKRFSKTLNAINSLLVEDIETFIRIFSDKEKLEELFNFYNI